MSFLRNQKKSIVLTGEIGSGKTTLFNKICKENQKVEEGGESVTQCVFSKNSAYGEGFKVLDTPGFGSDSNKIAHACAIMCALTEGPLNQILMVLKVERTPFMRKYIKEMINQPYKRFKSLVTVVITHWDNIVSSKTPSQQQQLQSDLTEMVHSFNISSIIFTSKQDSGQSLCNQIDNILARSDAQNVKLTDTEFYSSFDLVELTADIEINLIAAKGKVNKMFESVVKSVRTFIQNFNDKDPCMPEVMHYLTLEIKNFATQTIQKFENENATLFDQLYEQYNDLKMAYLLDVVLKKELMGFVEQLVEQAQKKMGLANQHCFNFIKQCPFCQEIWFKVSGCDGATKCGEFPDQDEARFALQAAPKRYKFRFTEEKLIFEDLGEQHWQQFLAEQKKYQLPRENKIGCNATLIWKELKPLDPIKIKELLDSGVLDYLAKEIQEDDTHKKLQISLQEKVQKQFKETKIIQL